MRTDSIFYRLFLEFPGVFFQLIGKSPDLANSYQFRSVEIKQTSFRLDGILVPNAESPTTPIHFGEVQMQKDLTFYRRFFAEIFLYLYQYGETKYWQAVVVFPNRNTEPSDTQPYQALLNSQQVTRVYLEDLGETAYQNLGLGIVRLIVEAEQTAVARARELAAKVIKEVSDKLAQKKVLEFIQTILLYKFSDLEPQEVLEMLGLEEEFKQSRFYRGLSQLIREELMEEVKEEVREELMEEVKEEVRQECIEEGQLLNKLQMIPLFLELGLTVEEIAQRLSLTTEQVQEAAASQSNE